MREEDIMLLDIFVLFEQTSAELYGLEFWVECDVEHGCGLKMDGNYTILEIGMAEVAFG